MFDSTLSKLGGCMVLWLIAASAIVWLWSRFKRALPHSRDVDDTL